MKRLTDQQKIEIVEKYKEGSSSIKLSKEYGISKQSIYIVTGKQIGRAHV